MYIHQIKYRFGKFNFINEWFNSQFISNCIFLQNILISNLSAVFYNFVMENLKYKMIEQRSTKLIFVKDLLITE